MGDACGCGAPSVGRQGRRRDRWATHLPVRRGSWLSGTHTNTCMRVPATHPGGFAEECRPTYRASWPLQATLQRAVHSLTPRELRKGDAILLRLRIPRDAIRARGAGGRDDAPAHAPAGVVTWRWTTQGAGPIASLSRFTHAAGPRDARHTGEIAAMHGFALRVQPEGRSARWRRR